MSAERLLAEIAARPRHRGALFLDIEDMLEIDAALAAGQSQDPSDWVTRESAVQAIEHVTIYNGGGRDRDARDMLVSATQPQAPQGAVPLTVADIVKTPGIAGLKAAPLLSKLKAAGFDVTLNQPLAPDHIAALIVMPTACGNDRPQGAVTLEQLEAAFEAEIAKVSHVAYDSNEICRHFFNNIRTALCAAPETPEGKK